jgi:hypothetical protein
VECLGLNIDRGVLVRVRSGEYTFVWTVMVVTCKIVTLSTSGWTLRAVTCKIVTMSTCNWNLRVVTCKIVTLSTSGWTLRAGTCNPHLLLHSHRSWFVYLLNSGSCLNNLFIHLKKNTLIPMHVRHLEEEQARLRLINKMTKQTSALCLNAYAQYRFFGQLSQCFTRRQSIRIIII